MHREDIVNKFRKNPKYMTNGAGLLSKLWNTPKELIIECRNKVQKEIYSPKINITKNINNINNILIIGDLHLPFELDGYLEFCKNTYIKYKCNQVIFIGDIIDNHYSSYHETNTDGMGGLEELELAIKKVKLWYNAFPIADIIIGNHDRLIMRKAQTSAIPSKWIKEYKEVLETPNWRFTESIIYNDVTYIHGEGGTAENMIKANMQNIVQGHLHTQAYCKWAVGTKFKIFGMQVGCGIDRNSYGMAYAKAGKKPAIGCAVVLDNGKQPINILMDL